MRLPVHCKMRPDSPAFRAEEFRVPNQTRKEPLFPCWNYRESPRTLSQKEKNTDVTLAMQNRLVTANQLKMKHICPALAP